MKTSGLEAAEVEAHLERSRRRALRDLLPAGLTGLDTLDLGCGAGDFAALMIAEGQAEDRLAGIDRDAERIAAARARFPRARFRIADLRGLELGACDQDLVVLSQVLSQIPAENDRRELLHRAAAVLRPGGRILVHDMLVLRSRSRRQGLRRFSPRDLATLLPPGFALRSLRRCTLLPPLLRLVAPRAPRLAERLEGLRVLRGHWMALLEETAGS